MTNEQALTDATAARLSQRPWPATPIKAGIEVSFEFFPAATEAGETSLIACADHLAPLDPAFVSVTYGAGGTTQERTLRALERLRGQTNLDVAGHLTCVGATKDTVHGVIDEYEALGVRRIVALRGDPPAGETDGTIADGYRDAASLVEGIRNRPNGDTFDISVAAYPEVHPKADSAQADLDNLKRKFDAGADRAITQFFFDTESFLRFLHKARSAGITAPIVPGIMPVTHFGRVSGFAERCGTSIPAWMPDLFGGLDDDPAVQNLIAATVAAEQCRVLAEHGVRNFHFYTMNKPQLTAAVCRILGVKAESTTTAAELAS